MRVTLKIWNDDKCAVEARSITGAVADMLDPEDAQNVAAIEDAAICYITETLGLDLDFSNVDFSVEI